MVTLLTNQRAACLPQRVLRRVRHRRCSVYAGGVHTARLARSEQADWKRVSWRGPYDPLRLECAWVSRYLRVCTRHWALWRAEDGVCVFLQVGLVGARNVDHSLRTHPQLTMRAARLGLLFASALSY